MAKDYYDILGVDKGSTKEEIKRAYKRLAKKYHPDRFTDEKDKKEAEAKFKEINEAASVLADEKKRAQYDRFGSAEGMDFSGFDFSNFSDQFGGFSDFGDIFDMFFGGGGFGFSGGGRRGGRRGSNLRFDMSITLEEAADGVEKTILVPKLAECEKCSGTGAKSSSDVMTCDVCHGSGRETVTRRSVFGMFQTTSVCRKCNGTGSVIKNPCPHCDGEGRVKKNARIKIKIPAGVEDGMRLRVSGEGEAGPMGAQAGDLFVVIHIEQHKFFERHGQDLYMEMPITFAQAALGDTVEIPTLTNKVKLKIPPGTQTHTIFDIKGKGLPSVGGFGRGSQKVRVIVDVPKDLSRKQKDLLKEFEKDMGKKGMFRFF